MSAARPSALDALPSILERLRGRPMMVFLDYDGTLTPIVPRPEDAVLSDAMRARVRALAARVPIAVVSGRDRMDVAARVGLPELAYVGSHGLDLAGPLGSGIRLERAAEFLPDVDAAEAALRAGLAGIPGALVERKRLSVAAHYRMVAEAERPRVAAVVEAVRAAHPRLRRERGKAVFELRPDVAWDKGAAVRWLLERMRPGGAGVYLGDDLTDETAFAALRDDGLGIAVGVTGRETAAAFALRDPDEVGVFLERLAARLA